jgi:hypothetical protein
MSHVLTSPESLERAFRDEVAIRSGVEEGNLKIAIEEAMRMGMERR